MKSEQEKVKDFYKKQDSCPHLKWVRDASKIARATCTNEGNAGGSCKYATCPKVNNKNRKTN
jgi:hypothetical protein